MTAKLRLLCTLLLSALVCCAQDSLEQVRTQLARIEQGLKDKPIASAENQIVVASI
jgi:hypothetical protein